MTKAKEEQENMNNFDYLSSGDMTGFESMDMSTMSFPFLRILQDLSPQVRSAMPEYNPDVKAGEFFNTIENKSYGKTVRVVVGKFERQFLRWRPNRGGFFGAFSPEAMLEMQAQKKVYPDARGLGFEDVDGNIYNETFSYYLIPVDHQEDGVLVFSCSSTFLKEARKLNRRMSTLTLPNGARAMPYHAIWQLSTVIMQNQNNQWFGFKADFDSYVNPEQYAAVQNERKELAASSRVINYAALEGGETVTPELMSGSEASF